MKQKYKPKKVLCKICGDLVYRDNYKFYGKFQTAICNNCMKEYRKENAKTFNKDSAIKEKGDNV